MTDTGGMLFSSEGRMRCAGAQLVGGQGEPSKAPRRLRIIVADDDRDQVLTLMTLLRDEGHDVQSFYRGEKLVQAVGDFHPDAVIVDIKLPDASGFELAEKIRERFGRKLLLIAISGVFTMGADRVLCEIMGFDHHLSKPFELDTLLQLLAPLTLPPREQ